MNVPSKSLGGTWAGKDWSSGQSTGQRPGVWDHSSDGKAGKARDQSKGLGWRDRGQAWRGSCSTGTAAGASLHLLLFLPPDGEEWTAGKQAEQAWRWRSQHSSP